MADVLITPNAAEAAAAAALDPRVAHTLPNLQMRGQYQRNPSQVQRTGCRRVQGAGAVRCCACCGMETLRGRDGRHHIMSKVGNVIVHH